MKQRNILIAFLAIIVTLSGFGQKVNIVADTMTSFTLPSVQGGNVSLSDFKGKNVLIIFPRGRVDDGWCHICHYQYAEYTDLELKQKIQEKYNLQILFILPYDKEIVEKWVKMLPKQMKDIEGWKHPANPEKLSEGEKNWMKLVLKIFPHSYNIDSTNIPIPFPVLADTDHALSKSLGIYSMQWDNSYVEQNISSIYLVDKNGILQFKYVSQNTFDRPEPQYLFNVIEKLLNN